MIPASDLERYKRLAERLALDALDIETREPLHRGEYAAVSVEDAEEASNAIVALVAEIEHQAAEIARLEREGDAAVKGSEASARLLSRRTELHLSAVCERDTLSARVAELEAALKPFVDHFNARREAYMRRYKDHALGLRNFDKMPDNWEMEKSTFPMGTFRAARRAIGEKG